MLSQLTYPGIPIPTFREQTFGDSTQAVLPEPVRMVGLPGPPRHHLGAQNLLPLKNQLATRHQGYQSVIMASKSTGIWVGAHSLYAPMLFTHSINKYGEYLLYTVPCFRPWEYNSK